MDGIIRFIAIALIIIYIIFAIWFICKRQSVWASIVSCAGFIGGSVFLIPLIEAIATFAFWAVIACIVFGMFASIFS